MSAGIGSAPVHDSAPAGRHWSEKAIVLALSLAAMIVSMMLTLVVPILSLIQNSLHTTAAGASWVTTATLLSAAVFTPLLGRFGDQHGKKPTLVGVLLVLIAGTVLAATTHSLLWLITGRVLQGAATAIFPSPCPSCAMRSARRNSRRRWRWPAVRSPSAAASPWSPQVCSQRVPTPTTAACSGWPPGSPSSSSSLS